jgi:hypothetical protein
LNDVISASIYEGFRDDLNKQVKDWKGYVRAKDSDRTDRDQAKSLFFNVLYSHQDNKKPFVKVLKDKYSVVFDAYDKLKQLKWSVNPSVKRFSNVSFLMNRLESYFMDIVRAGAIEKGVKWFLTIHDQVICQTSEVEIFENLFENAFIVLGIEPAQLDIIHY